MALSTEQIRTLLADRLAELDAFKYMDEVLSRVQEAEHAVKEAKKELAKLERDAQAKQDTLVALEQKAASRKSELEEAYAGKEAALQYKLDEMQKELTRKADGLKAYQAELKKIEEDHKTALATWQDRLQEVRSEHGQAVAKLEAVKQQLDALAAMVGGKR